ncbi:pyridoxamine 5'-phosphate oxidase family protein [Sphingomonas sp. RIT328]|uniref:pyridoxamine 5'-phosphate oxidase family protein n=1 Tax=Sphingomonas sp. RIT328 TaxID=1470591 RepID=UPI0004507573|nr:pyridoxamine 5'-phosphate oxidase family protein [Sphingomonas sp. RIT328]EZP54336.1 PPOX class probable F420-dependent enzyme [Sphingomonas sp. RIT328]
MSKLSLHDLSKIMAKLDYTMMATRSSDGTMTARPMSNNGDVEYEGDSYFFAYQNSRKIADLRADPHVTLSYTGAAGMLGGPPLFVTVEGVAALIEDKAAFADHWTKDLDRYFPEGIDTPGVVMIRIDATTIRYWDGGDEGVISI